MTKKALLTELDKMDSESVKDQNQYMGSEDRESLSVIDWHDGYQSAISDVIVLLKENKEAL